MAEIIAFQKKAETIKFRCYSCGRKDEWELNEVIENLDTDEYGEVLLQCTSCYCEENETFLEKMKRIIGTYLFK